MPVLNLDLVAPATVDVQRGEMVWKLRADVPSSILVRCFYLMELEERRPQMTLSLPEPGQRLDLEEVKHQEAALLAHEEQEEEETLAILGAIWRWTYAGTPDEDIRALLSPTERRQIVQAFFLILLARYGKLPTAPTSDSSRTDSKPPSTTPGQEEKGQERQSQHRANSRMSKARGSTRSAMRSSVDSFHAKPPMEIRPTLTTTTTANGARASIY